MQRHRIGHEEDVYWSEFPGVRATLARWKILPAGASVEDVAKTGLRVRKILYAESDPPFIPRSSDGSTVSPATR